MGQVRQGEVDEKGRLPLCVYSNCVALKGMMSRVYSPQVPWSYPAMSVLTGQRNRNCFPALAETEQHRRTRK